MFCCGNNPFSSLRLFVVLVDWSVYVADPEVKRGLSRSKPGIRETVKKFVPLHFVVGYHANTFEEVLVFNEMFLRAEWFESVASIHMIVTSQTVSLLQYRDFLIPLHPESSIWVRKHELPCIFGLDMSVMPRKILVSSSQAGCSAWGECACFT